MVAFILTNFALVPFVPLVPFAPATAKLYENILFIVIPPHVTGIVTLPFLVVNDVVTVNVTLAEVLPLLFMVAVIPVGKPLMVPTVHAVLVVPLYPTTLVATLVATALPSLLAANV